MDEGMCRSMVEDPEVLRKRKLSRARVNERLKVMGSRRLDTVNDGSCQFAAVVQIGNLDFSIEELRTVVVDHFVENKVIALVSQRF